MDITPLPFYQPLLTGLTSWIVPITPYYMWATKPPTCQNPIYPKQQGSAHRSYACGPDLRTTVHYSLGCPPAFRAAQKLESWKQEPVIPWTSEAFRGWAVSRKDPWAGVLTVLPSPPWGPVTREGYVQISCSARLHLKEEPPCNTNWICLYCGHYQEVIGSQINQHVLICYFHL